MIPFLSWNNFFKKLKITCVRLLDPGWWTGVRCLLPLSGKSPRPAFSWLSRPQVIAIVYCHVSASCLDLQPLAMASNGVKGTIVDAGVGQVDPHEVWKRCKNPDFRKGDLRLWWGKWNSNNWRDNNKPKNTNTNIRTELTLWTTRAQYLSGCRALYSEDQGNAAAKCLCLVFTYPFGISYIRYF